MSCEHDCTKPAPFPRTIWNRPGLARIDYRIGSYAELRERMFELLNQDAVLSAWTHRGADDPGIALLEGAATVGDILTFYQQLYANELYLRTAQWRESVAELVRLLGYRLAPGVGGEATFALAVKGTQAVTVPKGFGLKAQLEGQPKPAEFESTQDVTAWPHLNAFHLYRPRHTPNITASTQTFYVFSTEGIPAGLMLEEDDRVLIGAPNAGDAARLENVRILIVEKSWEEFGRLYVKFRTPISWSGSIFQLKAYKLGESFRHFGHNAPSKVVTVSSGTTTSTNTSYRRNLNSTTSTDVDPNLNKKQMPLDGEVDNLNPGGWVIVEATISRDSTDLWDDDEASKFFQLRKVVSLENRSFTWGMLSGSSTVLTLDDDLMISVSGPNYKYADIRGITIHEIAGASFALRAQHVPTTATSGGVLRYFGTDAEAQALSGRPLLLLGPDEQTRTATVTGVAGLAPANAGRRLFRSITLDSSFPYADFPYTDPQVTVYGNLVPATQGKTEAEIVLGTGDRRQTFQTFALPKSPLTYLLDETHTPAQVPELTVYADGIAWQQVDSFFNYGPEDAVYVVREDEDGQSYVQFGDGKNGRRLPSGLDNVTAVYRVGSGAYGPLKDGAKPSITGKLKDFDKLYLPAPVAVGADREDESTARVAAPGKMQSLGRMVSLADIEAEALALPHVLKVRAAWTAPEGVPLVRLTVLTASGETTDLDAVRDSMQTYNRCRGPARYAIDVVQGVRQYLYLHIEAGFDAARREDDVTAAIKRALGLAGEEGNGIDGADGLFGLHQRQFGQNAHKSQVIGAVQNATGVTWVKLKGAQILILGTPAETDPTALPSPTVDIVQAVLACADDRILALHTAHLILSLSKDEVASECAT